MDHSTFVDKYRSNLLSVSVDPNKAGYMYEKPGLMPEESRTVQAILRAGAFGGLLVGVVLFFFAPWWLALTVLVLGFVMFPVAQQSAARGVLEASLQNFQVYQVAVDNQVLKLQEMALRRQTSKRESEDEPLGMTGDETACQVCGHPTGEDDLTLRDGRRFHYACVSVETDG